MSFPSARITFEVVGENAKPIEGAEVEASFVVPSDVHRSRIISKESLSGGDGRFTAESLTVGEVSFAANKDGYYETTGQFEFRDAKGNRWMPWNPELQLVLRKKINPVKMYARNTRWSVMEIPVVGEPVGFDLMEYAWMPPYGGGKHPDFIFKLDRRYAARDDYDLELTISFPNQFDGIQLFKEDLKHGSIFKLLRHAPETEIITHGR